MSGLHGDGVLDVEEHELFGEAFTGPPPVVGRQAQAVGDFSEQGVAAVGRAVVDDGALIGDGGEESLVVVGSLAERVDVTGDVNTADEVAGVFRRGEVVEETGADPGHPDHLEDHGAVVGELDAHRMLREGVAGHGHEIGDGVHRLAFGRPVETGEEFGLHLVGGTPVVVLAGSDVATTVRSSDRALSFGWERA